MPVTFSDKRLRLLFYATWLIPLLIQCALVGLSGDEAYYWRYSKQLAWGYFDHPPLTALLVKGGYILFKNELGVRLFFAVLATGFIFIMERLINPSNLRLFYAIVLSVAFLQVGMVWGGGMMALPDFPLLFLEAMFFLLYQRYLDRPTTTVCIMLSVVVALMLLAKYHGVLVVGFVILSNLRLLTKVSFWLIGLGAGALLVPHILWQISNDFPSLRYHLLERSADPYAIEYTLAYVAGIPLITGPLIGFVLLYAAFLTKPKTTLERGMLFTVWGTYIFFLLMTFKGRVEANWTIIALVPLLYLGYKAMEQNARLAKAARVCFLISLPLILAARVIVTTQVPLPIRALSKLNPKSWCDDLRTRTDSRPAVFLNSYQRASLYEFYEGLPSYSFNYFWGRKNQFTLWDTEAEFQGKSVALISNWEMPNTDTVLIDNNYYPYLTIDNFRATSNLVITSDFEDHLRCSPGDTLRTNVRFRFSSPMKRDLEANPQYGTVLVYAFFQGSQAVEIGYTDITIKNAMIDSSSFPVKLKAPSVTGHYSLLFAAATGWLPPGINSRGIKLVVE